MMKNRSKSLRQNERHAARSKKPNVKLDEKLKRPSESVVDLPKKLSRRERLKKLSEKGSVKKRLKENKNAKLRSRQ